MCPKISKINELKENICSAFVFNDMKKISPGIIGKEELEYVTLKLEKENDCLIYRYPNILYFSIIRENKNSGLISEAVRKSGARLQEILRNEKINTIQLVNFAGKKILLPYIEGILLAGYSFLKYKKEKERSFPEEIYFVDPSVTESEITDLQNIVKAVHYARNLVNEPLAYLTAVKFSEEMAKMADEAGFTIEIFNKQKI